MGGGEGEEEEEVCGWGRRKNRKGREGGGSHGILEGSWGLGCVGIGGWGCEEEEEQEGVEGVMGF